jgi:hypothetical protein
VRPVGSDELRFPPRIPDSAFSIRSAGNLATTQELPPIPWDLTPELIGSSDRRLERAGWRVRLGGRTARSTVGA